jgi:HAD superfamily hydrolase (TIGR01549 family)
LLPNNVRWVFFDLGNTLIDESKPINDWIAQLIIVLREYNFYTSPIDINNAFMKAAQEFAPKLITRALEILVRDQLDSDVILDKVNYKKELEEPYPESESVLCALADRYQFGVIANQSTGTEQRLASYGLLQYFSVCLSSAEAGLEKPAPAIFDLALSEADCLPNEAVMIGDRLDNDIAPANKLGWKTIRVLQGFARVQQPRNHIEKAHHVVKSIGDLTALF